MSQLIQPSRSVRPLAALAEEGAAAEERVVHSGWLTKMGGARGGRKNWKRRWFRIKHGCLYYYRSEEPSATLLGLMPLSAASVLDFSGAQEREPPEWAHSEVCFECKRAFGATTRKHHCRHCGNSFCGADSSKATPIPRFGFSVPVRVCDACFAEVDAALEESRIAEADGAEAGQAGAGGEAAPAATAARPHPHKFSLPADDKPHMFAVKNSERELWLHADNAKERVEWVEAIRAVRVKLRRQASADDVAGANGGGKGPEDEKEAAKQWEVDWDRVTVLNKVGAGAFGEVYRGLLWGTEIAVKKLRPEEFDDAAQVLVEIQKEIEILSQLRHPNVILYIGACTRRPELAILTEWCARGSLWDVLHNHSIHINARMILDMAMGVAQGMCYLHSLSSQIVHRDLKSHNILVDQNFGVKVADFGLSQVKRHRARADRASSAAPPAQQQQQQRRDTELDHEEHYGVFGTPEWMAPEVMEGQRYTEKIDVYSFGVLLTELVTRQMPFHDRYNVTGYMDIVDAVLDDGAIPTVPAWCDGFLRPLIEQCLSRTPASRPAFSDVIDQLRRLAARDESQFFFELDVPRLREQMMSAHPSLQAMAAAEIATLVSDSKIRRGHDALRSVAHHALVASASDLPPPPDADGSGGGAAGAGAAHTRRQSFALAVGAGSTPAAPADCWRLDDDAAAAFLERFAALLSSSNTTVQLHACRALSALLDAGNRQTREQDRRLVLGLGTMPPLLRLLDSSDALLRTEAGRVTLLLTHDLSAAEESVLFGLDPACLRRMERLVRSSLEELERDVADREATLKKQRRLLGTVANARVPGEAVRGGRTTRPKPAMRRGPSRGTLKAFKSPEPPAGAAGVPASGPPPVIRLASDDDGQGPGSGPGIPQPKQQRFVENKRASVLFGGSADKRTVADMVRVLESQRPAPAAGDDPEGVRENLEARLPAREARLPPAHRAHYPFARLWGHALHLREDDNEWVPVWLLLGASELLVFDSVSDEPDDPHYVIRVKTPHGLPTKLRVGAVGAMPFCFAMEDCGYGWYFCARSEREMVEWTATISEKLQRQGVSGGGSGGGGGGGGGAGGGGDDDDNGENNSGGEGEEGEAKVASGVPPPPLDTLPPPAAMPAAFTEYYGVGHVVVAGYLLLQEESSWVMRYFVVSNRELRSYFSHADDPEDCVGIVYLSNPQGDPLAVEALPDGALDGGAAGFRIVNQEVGLVSEYVLACRGRESRDRWVRRLGSSGDAQSVATVDTSAAAQPSPTSAAALATPSSGGAGPGSGGGGGGVREQHAARFAALYGPAAFSGYLWRKRRLSLRWVKEYYYMPLDSTEVLVFRDHLSPPGEPQARIYSCRGSGVPFLVSSTASEKRPHCFSVRNPARTWVLAAATADELEAWMACLEDAVREARRRHEARAEAAADRRRRSSAAQRDQ